MKNKYIIGILLCLSALVFITGLNWGLPSTELNNLYFSNPHEIKEKVISIQNTITDIPRSFYNPLRSYHPDEYFIIKCLQEIDPKKIFTWNQFSIGGAYLFLYGIVLLILSKFQFIHLTRDILFYFLNPYEMSRFYITGRLLCGLYAIGTVFLTYLLAKKIYQNKIATFLSGMFLIFSPLFLSNSHYMYVDIPGTFWMISTMYLSVKYIKEGNPNPYLLGLFSGISAANKITFSLTFFIPFICCLVVKDKLKNKIKNIFYSFIIFLILLFIFTPNLFMVFQQLFSGTGKNATQIYFNPGFYSLSLKYGLGLPLLLFLSIGLLLILLIEKKKLSSPEILLIFWIFFFFFVMSMLSLKFARYILPLIPPFVIIGTYGWFLILNKTKKCLKLLLSLWIIFVILFTFFYGMSYEMLFIQKNIRTEAGEWIKENIPAGSSIGVTEVPWQFQMPPFDYSKYNLIVTGYDFNKLKKEKPEYFIISSFQAPIPPFPLKLQIEKNSFWNEFINSSIYKEEKKFQKFPSFLSFKFQFNELPEDLIYLNPTIVIFRYKNDSF